MNFATALHAAWADLKRRGPALAALPRRTFTRLRRLGDPAITWLLPRLHRRRRALAAAVSVGLHLLLVLCFLLPRPAAFGLRGGGAIGNGQGTGDGVKVEMFDGRLPHSDALTVKTAEAEDSEALTTTTLATASEPSLTEAVLAPPEPELNDLARDVPAPQLAADAAANMGAQGTGGLTAGDGDDLWAAIAPCWRRVADATTLPVTLDVTFTADGGLAIPPVIERDPTAALDTQVMISESRAIQALAACGAYPMAGGRANVKIAFPHM